MFFDDFSRKCKIFDRFISNTHSKMPQKHATKMEKEDENGLLGKMKCKDDRLMRL